MTCDIRLCHYKTIMLDIPDNVHLVIFDLDNTLQDNSRKLGDHVRDILKEFRKNHVKLAMASLNMFAPYELVCHHICQYFSEIEHRRLKHMSPSTKEYAFYSKSKKEYMLKRILENTNTLPQNTLFFDDNPTHIAEAKQLGIKTICVDHNTLITWADVMRGLRLFKSSPKRTSTCS